MLPTTLPPSSFIYSTVTFVMNLVIRHSPLAISLRHATASSSSSTRSPKSVILDAVSLACRLRFGREWLEMHRPSSAGSRYSGRWWIDAFKLSPTMTLAGCSYIWAPSIVAPCPNPSLTGGQLISPYIQSQPWVTSPSLPPLFCETSSPSSLAPVGRPLLPHHHQHYPTNGPSTDMWCREQHSIVPPSLNQPKYKSHSLSRRTVQASYTSF